MKIFGKEVTGKEKKELIARFVSVVLSGVLLLTLGIVSFAWFAVNSSASQSGMKITLTTDVADILIERTSEYDVGYDGIVGSGKLKETVSGEGYSLTETDTGTAATLAYELVNEYVYDGKRYMLPGAYGTMTFYIRPKAGHDGESVSFRLERGGYADVYEDETLVIERVTSEKVMELLKGHVLFFMERTGNDRANFVYGGLVGDDGFTYDMREHTKCEEVGKTDCYKVVLYWEWPLTYYEICENISTTTPAVTKKYPEEMGTYLSENGTYFFSNIVAEDDEKKSDAYNDGDQTIGDNIDYFVVFLSLS